MNRVKPTYLFGLSEATAVTPGYNFSWCCSDRNAAARDAKNAQSIADFVTRAFVCLIALLQRQRVIDVATASRCCPFDTTAASTLKLIIITRPD